jgi:hypothetical protein
MQNTTHNDVKAALGILTAVADTIRELGEVPSGHLDANLMCKLSLEQFEQIIGVLKSTGLVAESNAHLLTWLGPAARPERPVYVCAVDRGGCGRTFPTEDGFHDHDCTETSSSAMSMLEIRPATPIACADCGKPVTRDDMGLCAECTEKSEHAEEGRR